MKTKKTKMSLDIATKMYNGTDQQLKEFALLNFPELGAKITDKVKTYSDACKLLNIAEENFHAGETKDEIAYKKLKVIARALNEGWQPNWTDTNESKYYPWFKRSSSGSGFSYHVYDFDRTLTHVGSRLVFSSRELATYAGQQFIDIYNDFLTL